MTSSDEPAFALNPPPRNSTNDRDKDKSQIRITLIKKKTKRGTSVYKYYILTDVDEAT